jgi:hypothetical protein
LYPVKYFIISLSYFEEKERRRWGEKYGCTSILTFFLVRNSFKQKVVLKNTTDVADRIFALETGKAS